MLGRDGWALEMREGDRDGKEEGRRGREKREGKGRGRIRMSPYCNFADFQIRAGNNNFLLSNRPVSNKLALEMPK
jgi:hypothetical protein